MKEESQTEFSVIKLKNTKQKSIYGLIYAVIWGLIWGLVLGDIIGGFIYNVFIRFIPT